MPPITLLDATSRWKRHLQFAPSGATVLFALVGLIAALSNHNPLPWFLASFGMMLLGIVLCLIITLRWTVNYRGHAIAFEYNLRTLKRLIIDGRTVAAGGMMSFHELRATIREGQGIGDEIICTAESYFIFRCRIIALPKTPMTPGVQSKARSEGMRTVPGSFPQSVEPLQLLRHTGSADRVTLASGRDRAGGTAGRMLFPGFLVFCLTVTGILSFLYATGRPGQREAEFQRNPVLSWAIVLGVPGVSAAFLTIVLALYRHSQIVRSVTVDAKGLTMHYGAQPSRFLTWDEIVNVAAFRETLWFVKRSDDLPSSPEAAARDYFGIDSSLGCRRYFRPEHRREFIATIDRFAPPDAAWADALRAEAAAQKSAHRDEGTAPAEPMSLPFEIGESVYWGLFGEVHGKLRLGKNELVVEFEVRSLFPAFRSGLKEVSIPFDDIESVDWDGWDLTLRTRTMKALAGIRNSSQGQVAFDLSSADLEVQGGISEPVKHFLACLPPRLADKSASVARPESAKGVATPPLPPTADQIAATMAREVERRKRLAAVPAILLLGTLFVLIGAGGVAERIEEFGDNPLRWFKTLHETPLTFIFLLAGTFMLLKAVAQYLRERKPAAEWMSLPESARSVAGSTEAGTPITQIRFAVSDSRDVARQAIFHFSTLGYRLIEQRPEACVFQRGTKWGSFWDSDLRRYFTTLTVRTAPAAAGELWVSCDWSIKTRGAWITRRAIAILEAEGRGLEELLGGRAQPITPASPNEMPPGVENGASEPRFSRFAIVGAVWALFGLLAVIPTLFFIALNRVWNGTALPSDLIHEQPPLAFTMFMGALLAIGAGAPIGTTILGAVSIGNIKRSGGKIVGLPLAVADALFFPLLIINGAIFGALLFFNYSGVEMNFAMSLYLALAETVFIGGGVSSAIVKRVWGVVSRPGEKTESAPVSLPQNSAM